MTSDTDFAYVVIVVMVLLVKEAVLLLGVPGDMSVAQPN